MTDSSISDSKRSQICDNTNSYTSWSLAHKWSNLCLKNHSKCLSASSPADYFPTRVLEIPDDLLLENSQTKVILRISDELDVHGRYMTLSHCWGGQVPIKLTGDTLVALQSGISLTDLPRTFADAVMITRRFEIRYLWIDSLCIMQDNEADWRWESARMNKVYKNSWLNIAATGSPDPNGGCFFSRETAIVEPLSMDVFWRRDNEQKDHKSTNYLCMDLDMWTLGINESPLGGRAWVVQERFLSPRQIHFGSQQLFWECRENTACETLQGGLPELLTGIGTSGHLKAAAWELQNCVIASTSDKSSKHSSLRTVQTCPEVSKVWGDLVEYYSRCALTFARDKLVAISGIAQEIQQAVEDEYLAGMWRSELAHSLLWEVERGSDNTRAGRPRPLRAPSWSWASIDGPISTVLPFTEDDKHTLMISVIEAYVTSSTSGAAGENVGGKMRCLCRLYPAALYKSSDIYSFFSSQGISVRIGNQDFPNGLEPDEIPTTVGFEETFFFMLVHYGGSTMEAGVEKEADVLGLILQPDQKVRGRFERVARFSLAGITKPNVFDSVWAHEDQLEYEESRGDGWYIISIV